MGRRWGTVPGGLLLVLALALVAGCGGGDDGASDDTEGDRASDVRSDDEDATTTTLDKSPFCVAIRDLEELGSAAATVERTNALVLEQNTELAQLIEDAANNAPADAPSDVVDMLNDYRTFTQAVAAAAGDVDAALAALEAATPGFMTALNDHRAAFEFYADRCGTAPPV